MLAGIVPLGSPVTHLLPQRVGGRAEVKAQRLIGGLILPHSLHQTVYELHGGTLLALLNEARHGIIVARCRRDTGGPQSSGGNHHRYQCFF